MSVANSGSSSSPSSSDDEAPSIPVTDNTTTNNDEEEEKSKSLPFFQSLKTKVGLSVLSTKHKIVAAEKMPIAIFALVGLSLLFLLSGMSSSYNHNYNTHMDVIDMMNTNSELGVAVDGNGYSQGVFDNSGAVSSNNAAAYDAYFGPTYDVYSDPTYIAATAKEPEAKFDGEIGDKYVRVIDDFRFLTLGAMNSITNGKSDWTTSYPYLLNSDPEKIYNLAIGAVGPKYPSVCIQSLVLDAAGPTGNQEFDIIVLDYHIQAQKGLYELAKRLRMRYPDAIMILLRIWRPIHMQWFQKGASRGSIANWAHVHNEKFMTRSFYSGLHREDVRWQIYDDRDAVLHNIQRDFNAKIFGFPQPEDPLVALWKYSQLFDSDMNHLSRAGHDFVHAGIDTIIKKEMGDYPLQPRVGTWGEGDSCLSWFSGGEMPLERSENTVIERFRTNHEQYALSTGLDNPGGSGWVTVNNPFDGPRSLILSYMVTGGVPPKYPKTEIHIITEGAEDSSSVHRRTVYDVIPITTAFDKRPVHDVVTAKVGVLPPGDSKVVWKPVEESPKPFRITAFQVVGFTVQEGGILGPHPDFKYLESY